MGSGYDIRPFRGPHHYSSLPGGVRVFVVGAVVRYKEMALSMILNKEDRKKIGIISELVDAEFVEVIWSNGAIKITFKDFIEVVK